MSESIAISFHQLSIGFKQKVLIDKGTVEIPKGLLVGLVGLNGSGKTTLLKTILKEVIPVHGKIEVNGKRLRDVAIEEELSVVFTHRFRAFGLTVLDVVSMGKQQQANWRGELADDQMEGVIHYITLLGLEGIKDQEINTLSDGQFQKVMIAKALVQNTPIILMDEPTAFLDVKQKNEFYKLLRQLVTEQKKTIIVSTHDQIFIKEQCDKLLIIDNKQLLLTSPSYFDEFILS